MPVNMVSNGSVRKPAEVGTEIKLFIVAKPRPVSGSAFTAELSTTAPAKLPASVAKKDPFVQLEAVFLRNFVEAMLPADNAGMFGTGNAGEYWRSIMADQMANAIAVNGRTGIADVLRSSFKKV